MQTRKETTEIIIHCAATKPSMNVDAKVIDRWHREKGWLKIGYHYVICRDGTIEIGREEDAVGAQAITLSQLVSVQQVDWMKT